MKKAFVMFAALLMVGGFLAADEGGLTPDEINMASDPTTPPEAWSLPKGSARSPEWYGTAGRFWITGSAVANCEPVDSYTAWGQNFSFKFGTTNSQTTWNCSLPVPSGVLIDGFKVETYDSDATHDVWAYLWRFYFDETGPPTIIGSGYTSGAEGYGAIYVTGLGETIDNQSYVYLIRVVTDSGTDSNRFRVVAYSAYRQISPEPAVATFADVPVGAFGFRHIEALAASGITAGCGGGNFCPNNTVTRAQMAVFLAKALGLHWPN